MRAEGQEHFPICVLPCGPQLDVDGLQDGRAGSSGCRRRILETSPRAGRPYAGTQTLY